MIGCISMVTVTLTEYAMILGHMRFWTMKGGVAVGKKDGNKTKNTLQHGYKRKYVKVDTFALIFNVLGLIFFMGYFYLCYIVKVQSKEKF